MNASSKRTAKLGGCWLVFHETPTVSTRFALDARRTFVWIVDFSLRTNLPLLMFWMRPLSWVLSYNCNYLRSPKLEKINKLELLEDTKENPIGGKKKVFGCFSCFKLKRWKQGSTDWSLTSVQLKIAAVGDSARFRSPVNLCPPGREVVQNSYDPMGIEHVYVRFEDELTLLYNTGSHEDLIWQLPPASCDRETIGGNIG